MRHKVSPTHIPINISPKKVKPFISGTKLRKRITQEHIKLSHKNKLENKK